LLQNSDGRKFVDVSSEAGPYFEQTWLGRGLAGADFDDDGDLDLLVTHLDEPAELLRNDTSAGGHYFGIDLQSRLRTSPVGARVRVSSSRGDVTRSVVAGGSYESSNDERLLFSLPDDDATIDVEIDWPSGRVDRFFDLSVDQYYTVREGAPICEQSF
jgi:hypothetical protein